jgi:hypothetical protein
VSPLPGSAVLPVPPLPESESVGVAVGLPVSVGVGDPVSVGVLVGLLPVDDAVAVGDVLVAGALSDGDEDAVGVGLAAGGLGTWVATGMQLGAGEAE